MLVVLRVLLSKQSLMDLLAGAKSLLKPEKSYFE